MFDLTYKYEVDGTTTGVVCSSPVLGKVATIINNKDDERQRFWEVFPYTFSPPTHRKWFNSYKAAECYCEALAWEMHHDGLGKK